MNSKTNNNNNKNDLAIMEESDYPLPIPPDNNEILSVSTKDQLTNDRKRSEDKPRLPYDSKNNNIEHDYDELLVNFNNNNQSSLKQQLKNIKETETIIATTGLATVASAAVAAYNSRHHDSVRLRLRPKNETNRSIANANKRLSCEELENLKERFVDFIKLDPVSDDDDSLSTLPPPPPITQFNLKTIKSDNNNNNKTTTFGSSAKPSHNNSRIPNSKSMDFYKFNSIEGSNFISNLEKFKDENEECNNNNVEIRQHNNNTTASRLSVAYSESSASSSSSSSNSSSTSSAVTTTYSSINQNQLKNRNGTPPEPPARTVSIRTSAIYSSNPTSNPMTVITDNPNDNSTKSSSNIVSMSPAVSSSSSSSSSVKLTNSCNSNTNSTSNPISDDCISLKSSIYATSRDIQLIHDQSVYSSFSRNSNTSDHLPNGNAVRSSRSVFSIYEEEDENSTHSSEGGSSSSNFSGSSCCQQKQQQQQQQKQSSSPSNSKLSRLNETDTLRIESMYRSMGCIVQVATCTCDFLTTTSEQIASLLDNCWNVEAHNIVPVWLFDTGYNPKRCQQLRIMFVDRYTTFPTDKVPEPIVINKINPIKMPKGQDKRLTFTMKNSQLVCLLQFHDLFSCQDFFRFYSQLGKYSKFFLKFLFK
jgi:hypothetical protein